MKIREQICDIGKSLNVQLTRIMKLQPSVPKDDAAKPALIHAQKSVEAAIDALKEIE